MKEYEKRMEVYFAKEDLKAKNIQIEDPKKPIHPFGGIQNIINTVSPLYRTDSEKEK